MSRLSALTPPALLVAVVVGALVAGAPAPASAAKGSHVRYLPDWEKHPSARYAAMSGESCLAELTRRGVAFTRVEEAPGVVTPLRLPRDVGGVVYRTEAPDHVRASAPYDIFDCRLVLALSDFSRLLRAHDVDEVRIFSAYRPEKRGRDAAPGTRHAGGLAIDARRFGKRRGADRVWLDVEHDFPGAIGAPACGPGAAPPAPATPEAREIRSIACEAADLHLFTSILTPAYDRFHRNHFHLEITPQVRWTLVR
jgi:hypothetical protein